MGIRDYFAPGHLCLVEWPSRGAGVLPAPDVCIELTPLAQGRSLHAKGYTPIGQQVVEAILGC
jgi:tRNA threonylcarbamoyladenosine biosynthesis protein TsaE